MLVNNKTNYIFSMQPTVQNRVIPKAYVCRWNHRPEPEFYWELKVSRFQSLLLTEMMNVEITNNRGTKDYDDQWLRKRSYRNTGNYTSRYSSEIGRNSMMNHVQNMYIEVQNMMNSEGPTFEINICQPEEGAWWNRSIYQVLSSMFTITLCCLCCVACARCCRPEPRVPNYNVEAINPNWD